MRTLAIGDIHGCLTALETLAEHAAFAPDDRLVFVGDYVDRGPDSRGVIDYLIDLKKSAAQTVLLKGNHEIMMMWARENQEAREKWLSYGGDNTLKSYGVEEVKEVPKEHWRFMEDCYPFYETDTHIFIHANLVPDQSLVTQLAAGHIFWEPFDPKKSNRISPARPSSAATPVSPGGARSASATPSASTRALTIPAAG